MKVSCRTQKERRTLYFLALRCAIRYLVLGAGLDVQQPHDSGIISAVLFKLLAQRFNLRLTAL